MAKYISVLFCILISVSCATINTVSVELREPAVVSFDDPKTKSVIIVNNSASQADENIEQNGEKHTDASIISTDSAKALLLNSLRLYVDEENYFSKVSIYPYATNSGAANDIKNLSARKLQTICQEGKADIVVSLDLFITTAELETVSVDFFNNYNLLSAKLGAILKVYSIDGSSLSPPIVHIDSLFRESVTTWNNMKNSIPVINDLVREITMKAADALTGSLIPSWKTENRQYYSDNSKEMRNATKFVLAGKWQEAADIWGTLYDKEKNINQKTRLASNIALANENLDDIENALAWINIAYDMLPEKSKDQLAADVLLYKGILTKRENNIDKLYKQLGLDPPIDMGDESEDSVLPNR